MTHNSKVPTSAELLTLAETMLLEQAERTRWFSDLLLSEPGWAILLELYIRHERGSVSTIETASFASRTSIETARRWINALVVQGWVTIDQGPNFVDPTTVSLSPTGLSAMRAHLTAQVG